jgi:adenylate cyclase
VLPFSLSGDEQPVANLSNGMTGELVRELARYSSIFVLGPQSVSRFGPAPDVVVIGEEAGVGFVLSGGIQHVGQRIRVAVQLNDTDTGGVAWAEAYERDFAVEGMFDLQTEIAREIVRRIAQPQGAIALFDWKRTRGKAPETWDAYDCVIQADDLRRRVLPPALAPDIRACLQRAVEQEPGYADAWVMHALVQIDALRFTPMALVSAEGLELAHGAARRAVELAPDSGRAHLALAMALFFRGEVEQSLAVGEVAARLSPHDPDILGEVGMRNILSGDLEAGISFVRQAIGMDRSVSVTSRLALALASLRKGQYQKASDTARGDGQGSNFTYWSLLSAIHGKAGRLEEARFAAGELLKLYPDFADWAWKEMEARNMGPELAAAMAEGWRAAGLPVPLSASGSKP